MKPIAVTRKFWINVVFIIVLFVVSVLVRLDNLRAPMGRAHEWLTGHVLTTLSIYEKNGIAEHYFSPVWRFNNPIDLKIISKQAFKDKAGYNYYVSYPPFCFIAPYIAFKLTGTEISVTAIRVFGLLNQFACALLILLIINRFFNKTLKADIFIPAFIGYAIYLFSTGNLWFHSNVYFADMLVHLFVLASIYIFISVIEAPAENKRKKLILLFIMTFFGIYTEWIALFIAFFMGLFLFIKVFKNRAFLSYIIVLITATIFSLSLSVYQYSQIAGFELLKEQSVSKYKSRSGYDKTSADGGFTIDRPISKVRISNHYEKNYEHLMDYAWYCLYILLALIILNGFNKRTKIKKSQLMVFAIITFSILLHHFVFFNFTVVHDFSTLKSSILLTLFVGYVLGLLIEYFPEVKTKNKLGFVSVLLTVWFAHSSLQKYYNVYRRDPMSLGEMLVGESVKKYSKPDEVIFTDLYVTPMTFWYTQRNVLQVDNTGGCFWYLNALGCEKGLFIRVRKKEQEKKFVLEGMRVNNKGDSLKVF